MFARGAGPVVGMDEAHNNYHTLDTGLSSLASLLRQDGFIVQKNFSKFTVGSLKELDVLVIVNPLHRSNLKEWSLPCPSAFSASEIGALKDWVLNGGRLLLVADHMPIAGAVQDLASEFGVEWANCFDFSIKKHWPPGQFSRRNQTLLSSPLTDSSTFMYEINLVGTFTGSAFKSEVLKPLLQFDHSYVLKYPKTAWQFSKKTRSHNAGGWLQGAYGRFGDGKVVFLAEAAMFTSQLRNKTKIGLNSEDVPDNKLFALNIFRFLSTD